MEQKKIQVSIVIPVYNEEDNIQNLYYELSGILNKTAKDYEIIFVDDGSKDASLKILKEIFARDQHIKVISLLGNQGQTSALAAGFKEAKGEIVVAMDGDGQHNPAYIPQFIDAILSGFDMASGWKEKDAGASRLKFLLSRLAHRLTAKASGAKMKYFGATMKAYRRAILKNLDLSGDLHRFAGALLYYKGIKIKEIPIKIRPRKKGKSKYGITKIAKVMLDLILIKFLVQYSKTPFRAFGSLGVLLNFLGLLGICLVFIAKYFFGASTMRNVSVLVLSAICCIVGIQFIFFGLLAELVSRVYYTYGKKKIYNVREKLRH